MNARMLTALVFLFLVIPAFAFGNPAMLPKHPGYPAGGEFANDVGQRNNTLEQSSSKGAAAEDSHTLQSLKETNNDRLLESQGAGRLPKVQGPNIRIDPPVASATIMPK